jgi:hypothetical protein
LDAEALSYFGRPRATTFSTSIFASPIGPFATPGSTLARAKSSGR